MQDRMHLSVHSVESEQAMELPDRMALSLVNANAALPINAFLT